MNLLWWNEFARKHEIIHEERIGHRLKLRQWIRMNRSESHAESEVFVARLCSKNKLSECVHSSWFRCIPRHTDNYSIKCN